MIYTELTKKAMRVAFQVHKEQMDKVGVPYIYHPIHLAEQMDDELSTCAALLHDVVEDSDVTFEMLEEMGFPTRLIEVLRLLTHDDDRDYMEYVKGIAVNKTATKVKLADLRHNSDLTRLDEIDEYALKRNEKYKTAIEYLENHQV